MAKIEAAELLRFGARIIKEGNPMQLQCSYCGNIFHANVANGIMQHGAWVCPNKCNKSSVVF